MRSLLSMASFLQAASRCIQHGLCVLTLTSSNPLASRSCVANEFLGLLLEPSFGGHVAREGNL